MILIGHFGTGSRNPDALLLAACETSQDSVWLAPRFRTTVFQDSSLSTPWVAANDPVGGVLDKGGRGYAFTQPTATARPLGAIVSDNLILRGDGVDDLLVAGDVCSLQTYSAVLFTVFKAPSDESVTGDVLGKRTVSISTSEYGLTRRGDSRDQANFFADPLNVVVVAPIDGDFTPRVVTTVIDRAAGRIALRRNGAEVVNNTWTPEGGTVDRSTDLTVLGYQAGSRNWRGDLHEALVCIRPAAQITTGFLEAIEQRLAVAHAVETGGGRRSWRPRQPAIRRHRRRASRARRASRWCA